VSDLLTAIMAGLVVLLVEYFFVQRLATGRLHSPKWLPLKTRADQLAFSAALAVWTVAGVAAWALLRLGFPFVPALTIVLGGVVEGALILWVHARARIPWRRRALLFASLALPVLATGALLAWQLLSPPRRTIILVADFARREGADDYDIGGAIRNELRTTLGSDHGIAVQPLRRVITESDGSDLARRLGARRKATLVIWGWYGHGQGQDAAAWVSEHFETLRGQDVSIALRPEATGATQVFPLATLDSFSLQRRLAADASCLSSFAIGLATAFSGDWAGGLPHLSNAIQQAENTASQTDVAGAVIERHRLYLARGITRFKSSDLPGALDDLTEAIRLRPDFGEAYGNRGVVHLAGNDLDLAIQDFDQAIELQPDNAANYANRGVAHSEKGEIDRAIQDYDQAIRLQPDFAAAWFNRGTAYRDKGDLDRAIQDLSKASALDPDDADTFANRGLAYRDKGDLNQAIRDYDRVIRLKSGDAGVYITRADIFVEKGDLKRALRDYDRAIRLHPDNSSVYIHRGAAYAQNGDLPRAIQDLEHAVALAPKDANAYYSRGMAYAQKGDLDRAILDYDQAIALKPDDGDHYYSRGLAHMGKGELDRAIQDFDQAIVFGPGDAQAYSDRGVVYAMKGDLDRAIQDFDQAIVLKPELVSAYSNRGYAYELKGERNQATADFRKVLEISQDPTLRQSAQAHLRALGADQP